MTAFLTLIESMHALLKPSLLCKSKIVNNLIQPQKQRQQTKTAKHLNKKSKTHTNFEKRQSFSTGTAISGPITLLEQNILLKPCIVFDPWKKMVTFHPAQ